MKETNKQKLESLRATLEADTERVRQLPGLSEEQLRALFAEYCKTHDEVPPLAGGHKRRMVWSQLLPALFCMCVTAGSMVVCAMGVDDLYVRVLLCVVTLVGLLLVVLCLRPQASPLYRFCLRKCVEEGSVLKVRGYGLWCALPLGLAATAALMIILLMPVGDNLHMMSLTAGRHATVAQVTDMILQIV